MIPAVPIQPAVLEPFLEEVAPEPQALTREIPGVTRSAMLSQDGYTSVKEANLRASELAFTHELLRSQRPAVNSGVDRANALVQDRNSNVRELQGCHGFATPLLCTEHMKSHLGVPRDASKRIQIQYYEAGHMMYRHPPLHTKMKDGLDSFVSATART